MATALATSLMGVGFAAVPASLLGDTVVSKTGAGTAQGGSSPTIYNSEVVLLTTASSQTAATLSSDIPVGGGAEVYTITATTGLVFPPSGCTIDQGSSNASVSIAQNKGRRFRRVSATAFVSILSA